MGKTGLKRNEGTPNHTGVYREVWGFSWPLMLLAILAATMSRLDIFSVGYFLTMTDVGLYSAAYTLGLLIYFPAQYFNEMLVPTASQLFLEKDMKRLSSVYKTNTIWIFYVMFPVFTVFFFEADLIIPVTFGKDYQQAVLPFQVILLGVLLDLLGTTWAAIIHATGNTKIVFPIELMKWGLCFLLYILLIPAFGILGASLAFTGVRLFSYVPKLWYIWRISKLTPFSVRMFKYVGTVLSVYLIFRFFSSLLESGPFLGLAFGIISIPSAVVIYIMLIGLSHDDLVVLHAIARKINCQLPFVVKNAL